MVFFDKEDGRLGGRGAGKEAEVRFELGDFSPSCTISPPSFVPVVVPMERDL